MNSRIAICAIVLLGASCTRDEDERRAVMEQAQRTHADVARSAVVTDLRAPSDTGRLITDSPVSLREAPAREAGAREVWAPFGIASPDTIR